MTKMRSVGLLFVVMTAVAAKPPPVPTVQKSANGRYLVDATGQPFLMAGDSPQSLMVNISTNDADMYFANRVSHGFNTMWIDVLCTTYTGGREDGSTYDGILPFTNYLAKGSADLDHYDLTTPNPAYFARCDEMLQLANKYGLVVMLDPIETGGWSTTITNNGSKNCRVYGKFLGERYKNYTNIVWLSGNDYFDWTNKTKDAKVIAVTKGIKSADRGPLQSVEFNAPGGSLDDHRWTSVVTLNGAYTYFPTYAQILVNYQRKKFEPVYLMEANYEFEDAAGTPTTPAVLRRQEYWTDLSGATGQLYGSHVTWTFEVGWQSMLDTTGAVDMAYVGQLFGSRAWYKMIPDTNHVVVIDGYGTFNTNDAVANNDYLTAARVPDGSLVIAYAPTIRQFTVDMTTLSAPATARWYDPTSGMYTTVDGSPLSNTGSMSFTPPGNNNDGDEDWVLVLETPPP